MDYKSKYIKYKKKYLNLKNNVDDYDGGMALLGKNRGRRNVFKEKQCPLKTGRIVEECGDCISLVECSGHCNTNDFLSCCDHVTMKNYLNNVSIDKNVKENLMRKMKDRFNTNLKSSTVDTTNYSDDNKNFIINPINKEDIFNKLREKINDEIKKYNEKYNDWISCKGKGESSCFTFFNSIINSEIKTTAYILRAISNCILKKEGSEEKLSFKLIDNNVSLDGIWENDKNKIKIELSTSESEKTKRLIMGSGPSASGKTYMAKNIIKWLTKRNDDFPHIFLSIDGGSMREASVTYRYITKQMQLNSPDDNCKTLKGFKNLSSGKESLFEKPKELIFDFLNSNHNEKKISLYVPETLGKRAGCYFPNTCFYEDIYINEVKKYVDYTDDEEWIGLFIWQHKFENGKCLLRDVYKCEGVVSKGRSREIKEGKKYDSKAYDISFHAGLKMLQQSEVFYTKKSKIKIVPPKHSVEIHNSGGKEGSKSVIVDYTKLLNGLIEDKNILYLKSSKDKIKIGKKNHDKFLIELIEEEEKAEKKKRQLEAKRKAKEEDCRKKHEVCENPNSKECKKAVRSCMAIKNFKYEF